MSVTCTYISILNKIHSSFVINFLNNNNNKNLIPIQLPIPYFIPGVDPYLHLVSFSFLWAAVSSPASSLTTPVTLVSSQPLLLHSEPPETSIQIDPPCTIVCKLSKVSWGSHRTYLFSCLSEMTLLCYLILNGLKFVISYIDESFSCCFK